MSETALQILDQLIKSGKLDQSQYDKYRVLAEDGLQAMLDYLEKNESFDPEEMAQVKSQALNIPYVNLEGKSVPLDVLKILPQDLSENYQMIVFGQDGNQLSVGMVEPMNYKAVEAMEFLARKKKSKLLCLIPRIINPLKHWILSVGKKIYSLFIILQVHIA